MCSYLASLTDELQLIAVLPSVNPIYYVFFSSATILASLLLFQGFNTTGGVNTLSLICGFLTTFLGVYLLNLSRSVPSSSSIDEGIGRNSRSGHRRISHNGFLETGMLNPRISVSDEHHLAARDSLEEIGGDSEDEAFPLRQQRRQKEREMQKDRDAQRDREHQGLKRSSIQSYNHQGQVLNGGPISPGGAYSMVTDTDRIHSPTSMRKTTSPTDVVFDIGQDDDEPANRRDRFR